jgi:hypothetical protein
MSRASLNMGRSRWTMQRTVESCLALDVASFRRDGLIPTGPLGMADEVTWRLPSGVVLGRLRYVTLTAWEGTTIRIPEQVARLHLELIEIPEQRIELTTSPQRLGGERFWFFCECWRQVGKLYLPPGEVIFRCRQCHNLIHRSAQQHDHRVYELARDPSALLAALESQKMRKWTLGLRALNLRRTWMQKRRLAARLSKSSQGRRNLDANEAAEELAFCLAESTKDRRHTFAALPRPEAPCDHGVG